ncbi:uncharacterized protein A4U43_C01F18990 [Asparagus officinalis]|uniref:Uncharacterized protein n=1 Tax=Asparagus officinalis TaxID=4686 RepID=A0A5P1FS87_ASPOF|nr:uncharacterized protein A4U43_C01F18990 [Asparagus officinalis]
MPSLISILLKLMLKPLDHLLTHLHPSPPNHQFLLLSRQLPEGSLEVGPYVGLMSLHLPLEFEEGSSDTLHSAKEILLHENPADQVTLEGLMEADIGNFPMISVSRSNQNYTTVLDWVTWDPRTDPLVSR